MMYQSKLLISLFLSVKRQNLLAIRKTSHHRVPFLELCEKITGKCLSEDELNLLKKKNPNIDTLGNDRLLSTLQILNKFQITPLEACNNPHVFCMNPISMDNYGEILQECGFVKIIPNYIIKYHTIVRSRTLQQLKKNGLLETELNLEEKLMQCFQEWPSTHKIINQFDDSNTSILNIRTFILEQYLNWKINASSEEFKKYCRNYLPIRHRPMCDIQEAIDIAEHQIGFSTEVVRRNGFLIAADPMNSKLILENVSSVAGLDIKDAIKVEPAILKNNYNCILQIRSILEEYTISDDAQRSCLKVYCMSPKTVQERLNELANLKEYQVLKTNPRMLWLVVHKKKMLNRLSKMEAANKQCYNLNHLVSSSKVFNNYIGNFGSKVRSRDIVILICNSLQTNLNKHASSQNYKSTEAMTMKLIKEKMMKHKYCLHIAMSVIYKNIKLLQKWFGDNVILDNCQILLYPETEIQKHLERLLNARDGKNILKDSVSYNPPYNNLKYTNLTDEQILSLILYEIEKNYHFTGDGVWSSLDSNKAELQAVS